jgi:phenylalanyl-tRNA synthetase beta chain
MRLAKHGEKCRTLDEKEYILSSNMVVIADEDRLHGIGGVMGGLDSGCSMETKNVFLEVALFDPISVTKTGRELNLNSDARFRFERGIDNSSIVWGVDKATEMILDLCGGEASEITIAGNYEIPSKTIKYNFNKVNSLGGINLQKNYQKEILNKLGFQFINNLENQSNIRVPLYRPDIEGEADLVEEVLRIYGFDKIVPYSVKKDSRVKKEVLSENLKAFYKSKRIIASRGYLETITWSFVSSEQASIENKKSNVKIRNPISTDLDTMRSSIFPNLLNSINLNISRLYNNGKLFEIGPQFSGSKESDQQMMATGIQYGTVYTDSWNDEKRISDVFDIKSDVYFVLNQLNVPVDNILYQDANNNFFHPGKSAQLKIGKNVIAQFGEIHPYILKKFDLKINVSGFEIFLDQLSQFQVKKLSTKNAFDNNVLQAIERDFSFLFPKNIKGGDIINKIKKIDKQLIKKVSIFDVFENDKLPENMKSIAIKVILQPMEKTFTDSEIEKVSNNIIDLISKTFEGKLRQ